MITYTQNFIQQVWQFKFAKKNTDGNSSEDCTEEDDDPHDSPLTRVVPIAGIVSAKLGTDSPSQVEGGNQRREIAKAPILNKTQQIKEAAFQPSKFDSYSVSSFDSDDSTDLFIGEAPLVTKSNIVQQVLEDDVIKVNEVNLNPDVFKSAYRVIVSPHDSSGGALEDQQELDSKAVQQQQLIARDAGKSQIAIFNEVLKYEDITAKDTHL